MRIVVAARHTSSMDILTPTRVYCLYPDLLDHRENFVMDPHNYPSHIGGDNSFIVFNYGFRSFVHNTEWGRSNCKCGYQCPALWRDASSLAGTRIFHWGGIKEVYNKGFKPSPADDFLESHVMWCIRSTCDNNICEHFKQGKSLYDYIFEYDMDLS